jgi:SAM-dependent methyltransferase
VSIPTQTWSASGYSRHAHFVPALGDAIFQILSPQPEERILDLGCGDGVLTQRLVAAGASVVGVDSSPEMIAAAKARGLDARLADASNLTFANEFDAVFSNAVLHWIKSDPNAPIAGAYRALKPGGRFVGEFGGHGCVAAIGVALIAALERRGVREAATYMPQYFPTAEDYRARLIQAGFTADYVELVPRPTPLPTGMRGWLDTFAKAYCAALPVEQHDAYLDDVVNLLRPVLCDDQGNWTADYIRIRFAARKP